MSVNVCVVGTGYVGLIAAVGLSDFGNTVIGVDISEEKIELLNQGKSPIYEPGVEEYLQRNMKSGRLCFSNNISEGIKNSDVIIIAVGTPQSDSGEADLRYVEQVVDIICENINGYKVIAVKSTVPVGTNRNIYNRLKRKISENDFDVVSNPEFLREGKALQDFFHPDRTVIGYENDRAKAVMHDVYRTLNIISVPFVWCNWETAEIIKYASNTFLATKITFINEMAQLSYKAGADIHTIAKAMGMDGRISPKFLHPGPGYGGSCFPKDTHAMAKIGESLGVDLSLIKQVIKANEKQKLYVLQLIKEAVGDLKGKTIAIAGLAFKQETDDIRESSAIIITKKLLDEGASIKAHDPKAMENFNRVFPEVQYCDSVYAASTGANALVILTEWNEYRGLDISLLHKKMKEQNIIDTRNLLDNKEVIAFGFTYLGMGRQ